MTSVHLRGAQARRVTLRALAERVVGCPDLAEDVVQEACIALWRAPDVRRPEAWLSRVVVQRSLHHLRTTARRRRHECAARTCRLAEDPTRALEVEETRARVEAALAELPEGYRVPLELFELEGKGYAEIAGQLGIALGTVRSRIHRARRALRVQLEGAA